MPRNSDAAERGNPNISPTAYATAAAWARFGFPESARFDTRRGRAMLAAVDIAGLGLGRFFPAMAAGVDLLYWRHRWFTDWAEYHAPRVAIEIGAGLSARGVVHARAHPETTWHDFDLPGMVRARRRRMAGLTLPANYHLADGDLLDPDFGRSVADADAGGRAIAMTEGVIEYLRPAAKQRAWQHIAALLARLGGGRYLCEIYPLAQFTDGSGLAGRARRLAVHYSHTLCRHEDDALEGLVAAGFRHARILPEHELADADRAPAPTHRFFRLVEAEL